MTLFSAVNFSQVSCRYSTVLEKVMFNRKKNFKCKKQFNCGVFHLPIWKQCRYRPFSGGVLDDLCIITTYGVHVLVLWIGWLKWTAHPDVQSPPHRNTVYPVQAHLWELRLQVNNFSLPKESVWIPAQQRNWQWVWKAMFVAAKYASTSNRCYRALLIQDGVVCLRAPLHPEADVGSNTVLALNEEAECSNHVYGAF